MSNNAVGWLLISIPIAVLGYFMTKDAFLRYYVLFIVFLFSMLASLLYGIFLITQ
ncbi:MAG: hypothetical protein WA061_01715 [Microgenomates group bacterium]